MKIRVKCPNCGTVLDIDGDCPCQKCNTPLSSNGDGMLQIYRMGSPIGVAVGYGLYIDGQPMGHIGNKQSVRVPISAGQHNIHMTCGMTRKCQDLQVMVNPGDLICVKAHIKPGFWSNKIIVEPADISEMPKED